MQADGTFRTGAFRHACRGAAVALGENDRARHGTARRRAGHCVLRIERRLEPCGNTMSEAISAPKVSVLQLRVSSPGGL